MKKFKDLISSFNRKIKKKLRTFKHIEIYLIASFAFITILLGFIGFYCDTELENLTYHSIFESFYKVLQLFTLESISEPNNCFYKIARWFGAFVTGYSIIKIILYFTREQLNELKIRLCYNDHHIVCGLSWKAKTLIKDLNNKNKKVVIIEINKDHDDISEYKFFENIKIIIGDAEDEDVLLRANILNASYVYVFTENDETNLTITNSIQTIFSKNSNKDKFKNSAQLLKIRIHLTEYRNLCVFKENHKKNTGYFDYHAFNIYQLAAEKVVDDFSPDQYLTIKDETSSQVHILVAGLTIQSEFVILEAAQMYHFRNLGKLKISVLDYDIDTKMISFKNNHTNIDKVIDFNPIDAYWFFNNDEYKPPLPDVSVCFVCFNDDSMNINNYAMLRQKFTNHNKTIDTPQIISIFPQNTSMKDLFPDLYTNAKIMNIIIKELYNDFCIEDIVIENSKHFDKIAQYINYIYTTKIENVKIGIKTFDKKNWDNKSDFEKDWNRYPARHLIIKLRTLGLKLSPNKSDNIIDLRCLTKDQKEVLAKMEHRRWIAEKWLTGFVPDNYGIEKNLKNTLKYHPDLVEWEKLSNEEQSKDYYTIDNIQVILDEINQYVVPY